MSASLHVVFAIIGIAIVILVITAICVRQYKLCNQNLSESDEEPHEKKFEMSPSEVHEYRDFEKAMAGEIYAEKEQINSSSSTPMRNNHSHTGTPKGFEKFRRIPSLASEKSSRSKKNLRSSSAASVSPPLTEDSCGTPSFLSSAQKNEEEDEVRGSAFSMESQFGKEAPLMPMSAAMSQVSSRAAKSFIINRFQMGLPDGSSPKNSTNIQDVELFSTIAHDEAVV
jgi:hypothetical protein